jgi:hypothetical protein
MKQSPYPDLSAVLKSPQAEALMKNKSAIMNLMNSPEGRGLSRLLSGGEGQLQNAAEAVSKGEPDAIAGLMRALTQSEEGMDLIRRLQENFGK